MILNKAKNYDEVQVNEDFTPLELGGHKGIIKNVEEYKNPINSNVSLKVEVDTDKIDKQPGYYQEQYNSNTSSDKKWPSGAVKYVSLKDDENCVKMLKGFITAVENSNANFKFDWSKDTNQLIGKKVGLVFGWEEYTKQEGSTGVSTKLTHFRSFDKVDSVKIPKVKLLDGTFVEHDKYSLPSNNSSSSDPFSDLGEVVEISDDILD